MEGEEEEEEESGLMEVLFLCVCFWSGVCTTTSIVFIIVLGCHYWGLILLQIFCYPKYPGQLLVGSSGTLSLWQIVHVGTSKYMNTTSTKY